MGREEDRIWAELLESYHRPAADDGDRRWPAAEDLSTDGSTRREPLSGQPASSEGEDRADGPDGPVGPETPGGPDEADDDGRDPGDTLRAEPSTPPDRSRGLGPRDFIAAEPLPEQERFVPPEPPPLPRGDRVTRLAWAGALGGPALLLLATVLQLTLPRSLLAFAGLAFVAGTVTLLSRRSDTRGDGGGAVL